MVSYIVNLRKENVLEDFKEKEEVATVYLDEEGDIVKKKVKRKKPYSEIWFLLIIAGMMIYGMLPLTLFVGLQPLLFPSYDTVMEDNFQVIVFCFIIFGVISAPLHYYSRKPNLEKYPLGIRLIGHKGKTLISITGENFIFYEDWVEPLVFRNGGRKL